VVGVTLRKVLHPIDYNCNLQELEGGRRGLWGTLVVVHCNYKFSHRNYDILTMLSICLAVYILRMRYVRLR